MKNLQRAAVLLELIQLLRDHDSWCGETSVQKSSYLLQEMLGVPLELDFILYKYGPYSFDLTNELTALRADGIVKLEVADPRYGLRFAPGPVSSAVLGQFPKTRAKYRPYVEFIASHCGPKGVAELERLATAYYVSRDREKESVSGRAEHLRRLKPHVSSEQASEAVQEIDSLMAEAASQRMDVVD